jgi:hypothetical protein
LQLLNSRDWSYYRLKGQLRILQLLNSRDWSYYRLKGQLRILQLLNSRDWSYYRLKGQLRILQLLNSDMPRLSTCPKLFQHVCKNSICLNWKTYLFLLVEKRAAFL